MTLTEQRKESMYKYAKAKLKRILWMYKKRNMNNKGGSSPQWGIRQWIY